MSTTPPDGAGEASDDEIGAGRFPFAIIPLAFLVLVGIIAGLLLADLDDTGTTPAGTTTTVVVTISTTVASR